MLAKRSFDLIFALLGLGISAPLLFLIAMWIKFDSRGPVIYCGARVGRNGETIRIFKFRTMVSDAEQIGGPSTAGDDPRLTRVGRFLRKHKLDELPQFINVIKGDMSFVGPRPEVQLYVDLYTEEEKLILSIRPGITDLASLWNSDEGAVLAGSEDPELTYLQKIRPEKIRLQLEYVRNRTFWSDIVIMIRTAVPIFSRADPKAISVLGDDRMDAKEKPSQRS